MKALSSYLNEELIADLRRETARGTFPNVSFELAMQFFLTDGILPSTGLPSASFLMLEDWIRARSREGRVYSTTDLKNKTGEILDTVLQGKTVRLSKHGRVIAEIKRV